MTVNVSHFFITSIAPTIGFAISQQSGGRLYRSTSSGGGGGRLALDSNKRSERSSLGIPIPRSRMQNFLLNREHLSKLADAANQGQVSFLLPEKYRNDFL